MFSSYHDYKYFGQFQLPKFCNFKHTTLNVLYVFSWGVETNLKTDEVAVQLEEKSVKRSESFNCDGEFLECSFVSL